MPKISDVCQFLNSFAPTRLAEDWDNVGLLTGDRQTEVRRVMTCLTITPESADEAIARDADLIVAHHPLPFRPIKKLTTDHISTQMLWNLARHNISIYSPHTGFDSASEGINQSLAERLGLTDVRPLTVIEGDPDELGSGRVGTVSSGSTVEGLAQAAKKTLKLAHVRVVGALDSTVSQVAVACGSGGSFLSEAIKQGCDTLVTGEATFHTCLEAKANGVGLLLLGHYASERFAIEDLAHRLSKALEGVEVWASNQESDPIETV